MRKYFTILIAVIVFMAFSIPKGASAADNTYSAFEASKMVFNKHFVGNHLDTDHSASHYMRLAIDAGFLSVYTSQAKNKNDSTYSTALSKLNEAIGDLYSVVSSNSSDYANNAYQDPGTVNIFIASILVKKFNMKDLSTTRQNQVNYLYNNTKNWLNTTYNNKVVSGTSMTFRQVVENQYKNSNGDAPFSVNVPALHGGALALDSDFLFKQYGVNDPTDYPYRSTIANIGNYVKAINFGTYGTQGRLGNVGSIRDYVDVGYISWHSKALAMMAHGTVYTQYFSQRPSSTFMTEAEAIGTGFKTVYNKLNTMPQEFEGFGTSVLNSNDTREWLYSLTWTGNQDLLQWIDTVNGASNSYTQPAIVRVANNGNNQDFHRALEGLTGAMLKGLSFR